jgi:eukaryotic-like serine/threonine-protein kinase
MNSADTTSPHFHESLDALRQIDAACTRFEQALQGGKLLSIEEILSTVDLDSRTHLLRELLMQEMAFRSKSGESPSLEEYRQRFPEYVRLVKYLYYENFIPAHVGEFSIQRLLGRGSFGLVYQGWDAKLTRNVAIKVFRRDPADPPRDGNLLVEARTAAQLRHPGAVTVYAVVQDADGDEFLVLEYVEGRSLEDLLRSERLSPQETASMLLAVVQALQHAHQHGLVHRDLKPANILLDQARRPRVTDFGLALQLPTLRRAPEIAGTLAYMAPEQANGETHRLDARTDLWAVGVILYRLLAGRLPFSGDDRRELLEAIRYAEPGDLQACCPSVPPELARITHKCLAKRMSERYQSAAELSDDLSVFLSAAGEAPGTDRAKDNLFSPPITVVPKGLRCFDASDREFFLQLVPGPRDRHGVPQAVRFWERHLRELAADQTFRVGLLYGPSGCGKSSLVRAGILPRIPRNVKVLIVDATREETELGLIRELRRHFSQLSADLTLPEMLRQLREGAWLEPGEKLLIVFDQVEQWLHGWQQDAVAQLVETLRQCDGGRVQALILVRDDFWMPVTRFFQQLDVPLVEGFNASAVDLFDRAHAAKVLAAFGVSYGRLDAESCQRDDEQQGFLEHAIDELAQDNWIIPVRLCIFAEMVKSRPWSLATLREVGGAQGLGEAYLEQVFDGRSASPMHRLHRKAARLVLERLLPPPGTDIRGHLVGESELKAVSEYAERPAEFAALLRCLDQELRLITPSDSEISEDYENAPVSQANPATRLYQLTHDFLVASIRGWLNQTRRRTLRGRAELRLADYADAYSARQETRQLPSWWEWLSLLILTRPRLWRPREEVMMGRATRHHALRGGLAAAAAIVLGLIVYDRMAAIHVEGLVQTLVTSDSRDLPDVVRPLANYRGRAKPLLEKRLASSSQDQEQRVRVLLGLVGVGEPVTDELFEQLLEAEPPLTVAIAEILLRNGRLEDLKSGLWDVVGDVQAAPGRRLRAGVALARLAPTANADQWPSTADSVGRLLLRDVAENPGSFNAWVEAFAPARKWLIEPLRRTFSDAELTEAERLPVANILARYFDDDVPQLVELALESTPRQFDVFTKILAKRADPLRADLQREAKVSIPADATEEEKDRMARRQANAILLLRESGEDQFLWPALRHGPDPRLRSFLIHHLRQIPATPEQWLQRVSREVDAGIRQALILVLGSGSATTLSSEQRSGMTNQFLRIYREDVDSGVHSAAEWALRRLGCDALIDEAIDELSKLGLRLGFHWYVTKSKLTMIIFEPPGPVALGSPETEPGRDASDEGAWICNVDWSFAVSATEISQGQYLELCADYGEYLNESAAEPTCPVNAVPWFDAIRYCRLLSQRDGLSEAEMAIPAVADLKKGTYPNFLTHTGYRLPTEVEWEVACRAGTVTPRFFGFAPDLLPLYTCYIGNSGGQSRSVAQGYPNPAGLFDMLGNVAEWCYNIFAVRPESQPVLFDSAPGFRAVARYPVRGNDYSSNARTLRSANRRSVYPADHAYSRGFRVAHTVRLHARDE